jgi:transmembrane sensor
MKGEATDPTTMEALEWFVRMRDDRITAADKVAFEVWLAADTAHQIALVRAEAIWNRLDIAQPEIDRLRKSGSIATRRNVLLGSIAFLGGAAGLYAHDKPDLFAEYTTDIGERRSITLTDGSSVELGSYSALTTHFIDSRRRLELFRGEAFFDVSTDARRPFIVQAGGGESLALGTRFNVKYVDEIVTVSVDQHTVRVQTPSSQEIRLEQGWQVSYGRDGPGRPSQADVEATGAWRRDRIVFQDVPLRRVLTELERYRRGKIILMDSAIARIPVTAIFDTKQAESALQTIAETLPIKVLYATGYVAIVYSAT